MCILLNMKLSTCLFVIITMQCVENTSGFSPDSTCGVSKGCFKSYECGSGDCTYLVTWYRSGDQMKFSFTSTVTGSSKYLCLGFSGDGSMQLFSRFSYTDVDYRLLRLPGQDNGLRAGVTGQQGMLTLPRHLIPPLGDDSTIACKYVSGSVSVEGGYNVGESYTILSNPLEKISNVVVSATDATFTCTFDRQINSTNSKIFDLNTKWYLFIAEGFITDGVLQEHYASHPPKSEAVVDLFAFEVIIGGLMNEKTTKVHGLLMVLTWMVFASVGLVIARYFKLEWSNKAILGQKVWFQVHRACMVSVLILTVISFFVIILSAGGYRDNLEAFDKKHLNSHPVLGIVILILTCINPIMSFFRCSPDDSRRTFFNWAHFCVGVSAHILAVINIIFGLQLTKAGVKIGEAYVMYVYIAVYILFEVFFEILKRSEQSQDEDNRSDMNMITPEAEDTTKSQPNTDTNQKYTRMRRILLVVHLISLGIFSLTVIVYILLDIGKGGGH